jgi:hypothetical protein
MQLNYSDVCTAFSLISIFLLSQELEANHAAAIDQMKTLDLAKAQTHNEGQDRSVRFFN